MLAVLGFGSGFFFYYTKRNEGKKNNQWETGC